MNESVFTHSYHNITTVHPVGLTALALLCIFLFVVQRKNSIIPILILACFVAPAQRVVLFTLDFNFLRVMVFVGLARVLTKREHEYFEWKTIDRVVIAWALTSTAAYILLRGYWGAFIYKLGVMVDSVGMYFLFRCLVRDLEDVKHIVRWLAYLSVPVAVVLLIEKSTGHNFFSIFGGVPEFTAIRHGKLRAQGAFPHPIIAGCFWVAQLPLFIALWWQDKKRWLAPLGSVTVFIIAFASASSTPLGGIVAVILGGMIFLVRHHMPAIRWGTLAAIVGLHMVMKAPVWHLICRVDFVGGSTGWHRFNLIDNFIHRIGEWWLLGTLTTAHWGWYLFDTANMYVNEGVRGGLLTFLLFLLIIALSFQGISRMMREIDEQNWADYIFTWALGVSLFAHCMMFMAVSYFGQIIVVWFLLLASIASLSVKEPTTDTATEPLPVTSQRRVVIRW